MGTLLNRGQTGFSTNLNIYFFWAPLGWPTFIFLTFTELGGLNFTGAFGIILTGLKTLLSILDPNLKGTKFYFPTGGLDLPKKGTVLIVGKHLINLFYLGLRAGTPFVVNFI